MEYFHTPGPWRLDEMRNISSWCIVPKRPTAAVSTVCACRWRHRVSVHATEAKANAMLIATAPDLLSLARDVAAHFEGTDSPLGQRARDVIESATKR